MAHASKMPPLSVHGSPRFCDVRLLTADDVLHVLWYA